MLAKYDQPVSNQIYLALQSTVNYHCNTVI